MDPSIGHSQFKVVTGQKPHTLVSLIPLPLPTRVSEGATNFFQHLKEFHEKVNQRIEQRTSTYKRQVDRYHKHIEFKLSDLVLINFRS